MQKMILGAYTFDRNPSQFDIPKKVKYSSNVVTYEGDAYFSWGTGIAGTHAILEWEWMTAAAFAEFQSLLEDDSSKVWNTQLGTSYNVEIISLDGTYLEDSLSDAPWRKGVKLDLLIRSAV